MGLFLLGLGHLPKPMLMQSNRTARSARLVHASRPSGGSHPAQKTEGTFRVGLGLECYTLFLNWNVNFLSQTQYNSILWVWFHSSICRHCNGVLMGWSLIFTVRTISIWFWPGHLCDLHESQQIL